MKAIMKTASILLMLVLAASVEPLLLAQSGRGTLTGVVKDATGALVPGADVVITNKDNGVERSLSRCDELRRRRGSRPNRRAHSGQQRVAGG